MLLIKYDIKNIKIKIFIQNMDQLYILITFSMDLMLIILIGHIRV